MSIGQLYYYNKCLDKIQLPLSRQNLLSVELAGLTKVELTKLQDLDPDSMLPNLLSIFTSNYLEYLSSNSLFVIKNIWSELISPIQAPFELFGKSEYQKQVINWINSGVDYSKLYDLIKTGHILTEYEDFALFYGLRVIYTLTKISTSSNSNLVATPTSEMFDNLDVQPKIIAIVSPIYQSLFHNLNCLFIAQDSSQESILDNIKLALEDENQVELILIENDELLCKYLQKSLANPLLLITSINLTNANSNNTFFEDLVRKTLGIRLTT